MKKFFIVLTIILSILIGSYFLYKSYKKPPGIKILETAIVKRDSLNEVIVVTGILKLRVGAQVKIGTRSTGLIDKMFVKVGDKVRKGQLIAKMDQREIIKEIDKLESSLRKAKTAFEQIHSTHPEKIEEAKRELEAQRATLEFSRLEMERYKGLVKKGFVSRNDFDQKNSKYKQDFHRERKNSAALKRLINDYKMEGKKAFDEVRRAQDAVDKEKIRLSYTDIISPIDGVVSDVTAQEGETIVAGLQVGNLVTVMIPHLLEMWIYIDETDIGQVKEDLEVHYGVDTYPDEIFKSKVDRINPQPTVKDNIVYYIAIADIKKEDAIKLRPEMTTHVRVIVEKKIDVLVVPNGAVKFDGTKQVVYVIDKGVKDGVKKTPVKTGIRSEDFTEILSGLEEGQTVATKLILPISIGKKKHSSKGRGH